MSLVVLGTACTILWSDGVWAVVAVAVAAVVLVLSADSIPFLTAPWLQQLGLYSYGIYLWHPLVLWLTNFLWGPGLAPLAIVASVAIAVASFHVVEQPLRRRPQVVLEPA